MATPAVRALSMLPFSPFTLRPRMSNLSLPERASKADGFSLGASICLCEKRCLDFLPVAGPFFFAMVDARVCAYPPTAPARVEVVSEWGIPNDDEPPTTLFHDGRRRRNSEIVSGG